MNTEIGVVVLAAAPAAAYREFLYRPHGPLACWIGRRFEVVAGPGQRIGQPLRDGDVLLEAELGRMRPGRCTVLAARDLELMAALPGLAPGQLLLRRRSHVAVAVPGLAGPGSAANAGDPTGAAAGPAEDTPSGHRSPFRLAVLPPTVQQAFAKGGTSWREAVHEAIRHQIVEPVTLADLMFFMHHPERMSSGAGKLIEEKEADFSKLRAEWALYETIAMRILDPPGKPGVFLPGHPSRNYEDFVAAPTTGRITLMVHGRNWNGTGGFRDEFATFDRMQETTESLAAGDSLCIANWQFIPTALRLTAGPSGPQPATWADLLVRKANEDVKIRVIVAQHPLGSPFMSDLAALDTVISTLPAAKRDNFKYIVGAHPHPLGTHHQKFMVARKGQSTVAFCGGLDISIRRAPPWGTGFVWHDIGAKVEGLAAHDLEHEFAERWNREKDKSPALHPPLGAWQAFEQLAQHAASEADKAAGLNEHRLQMLRTVSVGPMPADLRRDDIWRGYFRLIGRATRFIYLENQYFYEPALADAIVRQAESQPALIVIVMTGTGTDDVQVLGANPTWADRAQFDATQNGFALRHEFFKRLCVPPLIPSRLRVYTLSYPDGILHSKLILVDDEALSLGSANANPRGFFFDSELNLILDHAPTVSGFRHRLWGHNLGVAPGSVAGWGAGQFFGRWDDVAKRNQAVDGRKDAAAHMAGEGVVPFKPLDPHDPRFRAGIRGPIHLPLGRTFNPVDNLF
jgi:phosphatidylserine/phosphatidylglycerophosphate/cardiolipin synthase-like enzyme